MQENPAVKYYFQNNSEASKDFHNKKYNEPHKTKTKETILKCVEIALNNSISGASLSSALVVAFAAMYDHLAPITTIELHPNSSFLSFAIGFQFVLLLTTGLSFGYLDYLKKEEYKAIYESERKRENWEYENFLEGEQREMVQLYISKGLSPPDAEKVINLLSKNKKFFVDLMMKEELELVPLDESISPILSGFIVATSHFLCGMLPSLPLYYYIQWSGQSLSYITAAYLHCISSSILFFIIGLGRSNFSVFSSFRSGLDMFGNGMIVLLGILIASMFLKS